MQSLESDFRQIAYFIWRRLYFFYNTPLLTGHYSEHLTRMRSITSSAAEMPRGIVPVLGQRERKHSFIRHSLS